MKFIPRSEATRNFIIESAADLFNKKGYAGTSVADLEKVTRLTKGSIYGNFENKEQVALAVFDYNAGRVRQKINAEVSKHATFKEKILSYLSVYTALGGSGGCPLQNTAVEADDTHEGLRERAADALITWKNDVVELLDKGIEAKEFKPGIDTEKIALTYLALIEGGILLGRATRNREYFFKVLDSAKAYIEEICT